MIYFNYRGEIELSFGKRYSVLFCHLVARNYTFVKLSRNGSSSAG